MPVVDLTKKDRSLALQIDYYYALLQEAKSISDEVSQKNCTRKIEELEDERQKLHLKFPNVFNKRRG